MPLSFKRHEPPPTRSGDRPGHPQPLGAAKGPPDKPWDDGYMAGAHPNRPDLAPMRLIPAPADNMKNFRGHD